uniref:Uncharacterized protein n=1 Tax=Erwinia amylovora ATCC BAA-2158 TaxID=889211 RepID=E5B6C0_ERWAM|nr:hypothetical protein predicted by Glimmer/Critica [Erwinia amylovora ATCC BAA-2158]
MRLLCAGGEQACCADLSLNGWLSAKTIQLN